MGCKGCKDGDNGCVKNFARCIDYEGSISEHSDLHGEDCVNLEDTTADFYKIYDEDIFPQLHFSEIGYNWCTNIDYNFVAGVLTNKDAVKAQDAAICSLFEKIEKLEVDILNTSIVGKIDLKCLSVIDDCNNEEIKTVKDLLQAIVNKLCL